MHTFFDFEIVRWYAETSVMLVKFYAAGKLRKRTK